MDDEFENMRGDVPPRKAFKQIVIDPILEFSEHKAKLKTAGYDGLSLAHVIKQMISEAYTKFVLKPTFGSTVTPTELKKLANSKSGKDKIINYMTDMLAARQNKDETYGNLHLKISEFMDKFVDKVITSAQ